MNEEIRCDPSFLNQRKTKTQKIIAMILEGEPDEPPPVGAEKAISSDHKHTNHRLLPNRNDPRLREIPRLTLGLPCNQGKEGQGKPKPEEASPWKDSRLKETPNKFEAAPKTISKQEEVSKPSETSPKEPHRSSELPLLPEDEMHDGWIKLWRKLHQSQVWQNPRLLKVWLWCLFRASHKERWVTVKTGRGTTEVKLSPGQFIFGRNSAARELKMKPSSVRNFIVKLRSLKNLDVKQDTQEDTQRHGRQDSHYSIISIINWGTYQGTLKKLDNQQNGQQDTQEDRQEDRQRTGKGHKQEYKEGKEKKPSEISSEISALVSKLFPGKEELFQEVRQAISSTRKTGKVSPSIVLALLKAMEKYPKEKIHGGIRTYLSKEYHREGKNEKYLLGVIRNHRPQETKSPQAYKTMGSPLLDAYYREQGQRKEQE